MTPDGTTYYAVTASAGGFVIPLPTSGSGTLTITASGGALGGPRTKTVSYTAGTNVKVDFTTADPVNTLPTVSISAPVKDATVKGSTAQITISRSGDTSNALPVTLTFAGTAVNGVDSSLVPSSVTIPAGSASVDLPVQSLNSQPIVKKLKVVLVQQSGYSVTPNLPQTKTHVNLLPAN